MLYQEITKVSLALFRERSQGKRVVLLYPWTRYRNLFLSHFVADDREGLLYYRIPNDATTLENWLNGLVQELSSVLGDFGAHLRAAPRRAEAWGEALAADLGALGGVLFIDEFDRVPHDDELVRFLYALVKALPDSVQLAFSSRLLTRQVWYDLLAQGYAVVLGTEQRKNDVMFTLETRPKPQLEIYAFGRGHALVNGQPITNWDGALPRNLFFYFVDRPLVTRDDIFQTFWPDLPIKEATNVFHVTKRKISERITMKVGAEGNYELTQYNGGFYLPSDKVVRHYDVADFQEALEQALVASVEHEEEILLRRAIDIYKAPFLQTIEMDWVQQRRDSLRQMYAQALISMGNLCMRRGDDERALGFLVRGLKETPEREDVHRSVMQIYIRIGKREDARLQYDRLRQILQETLNIEPSQETRALANEIGF